MRVLMVVRPAAGGMKQHVLALSAGLSAAGHVVELATPPDSDLAGDARLNGLVVHPLALVGALNPAMDTLAARSLARVVRRGGFDIVHAHGFKAGLVARLGVWSGGGKKSSPPIVVTAHNHVLSRDDMSARSKWLHRQAERMFSKRAARYIAVSDSVRRELVDGYGIPSDKVVVIHNGVDPAPFTAPQDREGARADLNLPSPNAAVIGLAARFSAQKGLRHLIAAVPALVEWLHPEERDLVVVIGGSGPLESELREQAAALGVSQHLRWPGHVTSIPRFLSALDVYVSPAETEALGIGLIEAGLAGVPVVATNVGGVGEVVVEGETGVLIPPRDPYILAREAASMLHDPEHARMLARAARERCLREFDPDSMIERTAAIYVEVGEQ